MQGEKLNGWKDKIQGESIEREKEDYKQGVRKKGRRKGEKEERKEPRRN